MDDVEHAADRPGAIEVTGAAANDFDAVDGELRLFLPVDPPADSIVERDIILRDQGAAR